MDNKWMELASKKNQLEKILSTNAYTKQFGLKLTAADAAELAECRQNALRNEQRVEFGAGIMPAIIKEFCDSVYFTQDNYKQTLASIQDIFYMYKNEMTDEITDDELLHFMKEQFETICYGDLEYLSGTCLDNFARAVRAGYKGYINTDGYEAYRLLDPQIRWDRGLFLQALDELLE